VANAIGRGSGLWALKPISGQLRKAAMAIPGIATYSIIARRWSGNTAEPVKVMGFLSAASKTNRFSNNLNVSPRFTLGVFLIILHSKPTTGLIRLAYSQPPKKCIMKKIIIPCILGLFLFSFTASAVDDKEAIKQTILGENKSFKDKDFKSWSDYWLHDSYVSHTRISSFGVEMTMTWDSVSVLGKEYCESNIEQPDIKIADDYNINVVGDMASANISYEYEYSLWGAEGLIRKSGASYILKKIDDGWKIVSLVAYDNTSFENNDLMTMIRLNWAGYQFLDVGKIDEAIEILELNTEYFPECAKTWDILGEAYMKKGDKEKATKFFRKSLELYPQNEHAQKMLANMNN
jgi:hypothetical protein